MGLDFNIFLGGEAGQGMQTIGTLLAKVFARGGYHIFSHQDYQSRIRGGHNFATLRVSESPVAAIKEKFNLVVALNAETITLHQTEVIPDGAILYDHQKTKAPENCKNCLGVPLEELAQQSGDKLYLNSVATGAVMGLLGFDFTLLERTLPESFEKKKPEVTEGNLKAARLGYDFARKSGSNFFKLSAKAPLKKILISGNEAIALGALAAGLKFYAGYPMTPSTGILTALAGWADKFDLVVEQTEDEIAAINMAIGAAYAGVRAMTATSGGGFCLMVEGLGLAGMTETPIVVVLGQRPGPSTGLPTRTEQGDLEFALHAGQGEFPRVILAPRDPEDAFYLTARAFNLAEKYQVPVIIMSDQYLADILLTADKFNLERISIDRGDLVTPSSNYQRYQLTASGISPRGIPGSGVGTVVADSDEHDESGHLTENLELRVKMVEKRFRKLDALREEIQPPLIYGTEKAKTLLVGWGSTGGALKEAVDALDSHGKSVALMHFNEIWPLPLSAITEKLESAKQIIAVENNYTGQLAHLITAETGRRFDGKILKYNGRPFSPEEIIREVEKII